MEGLNVKKVFVLLLQVAFLLLLNQFGYWIANVFHLPVPGNVIGMILLFLLLLTGVIKLEWVEMASGILIRNMSFFFVPISVGLMTLGTVFKTDGIGIMIVLIISAVIGIVLTGSSFQAVANRKARVQADGTHHRI